MPLSAWSDPRADFRRCHPGACVSTRYNYDFWIDLFYRPISVRLKSFEAIAAALESAGVRYLVAGGLAVAAHGYLRFTKDVDLVVELVPDNVERAFAALGSLGYKPTVPITSSQFANPELRAGWVRDKGMQVLQFWCDAHIETPIDVFVTEPFPFDQEYQSALSKPLYGATSVRFVSLPTLIKMKESVGRQQDIDDVAHLRGRSGGGGK